MTDTAKLRKRINQSGYKLRYIADYVGISYQALLNKINNTTEFKPSEIKSLCELIGISTQEEREAIFFAT